MVKICYYNNEILLQIRLLENFCYILMCCLQLFAISMMLMIFDKKAIHDEFIHS